MKRDNDKVTLIGYGGMSREYETRVYNYQGFEIRVPRCPKLFPPEAVSEEYGCIGASTWQEGVALINDIA